jgi:hypothetical protein
VPIPRASLAVFALLAVSTTGSATARQPPAQLDSARAQIRTTLRAFYFNVAHQDWEALSADILPAKVVAHRAAPAALVLAANLRGHRPGRASGRSRATEDPTTCPSSAALIDQAIITLDGDWAEVSVPHGTVPTAIDEFRLIHFEERWRIVYIDLFQDPVNISTGR